MDAAGEGGGRGLGRIAGILALAHLALALLAGATQRVGSWDGAADFYAMYAPGAKRLLAGGAWIEPRSGPGYPALLALGSALGLGELRAAQVLAALGATAIGWLSFLTFRRLVDERVALLAQLCLHVALFRYAFVAGNDVVYAAFVAASLWLLLRSECPRGFEIVGAGLLGGLAFATRYPAFALLVAGPAGLATFLHAGTPARVRLARCVAFVGGAALVLGPWIALNLRWHGELFPNRAHALVALEVYGGEAHQLDMRRLEEMEARFPSFLSVVAHDPARFAKHYAIDFQEDAVQLVADALSFPMLCFAGLGLLLLLAGGDRRGPFLVGYASLAFALVALAPYQARYHLAIWPELFLCSALGLLFPWTGPLSASRGLRLAVAVALAASLGVLLAASALRSARELADDPLEILPAVEVLAARAPAESGMLVSRKPHLPARAGLGMIPLWTTLELDAFLERLRADERARWLYVGPQEVRANPALAPLARAEAVPDWLELLHRSERPPACLYRVRR